MDQPQGAMALPNPFVLLDKMIDAKVDADALKTMMDMARAYKADIAKEQFAVAMNKCQGELRAVVRESVNTGINKKYAPVEDVQSDIKPVYIKHGFSCGFTSSPGASPELTDVHLDVTHVGGHTVRTTLPNVPLDAKGAKGGEVKTPIQGLMSSMSYAQGRLLRMAFNVIVADEDKDGQGEAIGPKQLTELGTLLGSAQKLFDEPGWARYKQWLFKWLAIEDLRDLSPKKFEMAKSELLSRIREKTK